MTRSRTLAAISAGVVAVALGAGTAVELTNNTASTMVTTIPSGLGAPPVKIVSVGTDKVVVDVGPSQPGPFISSNSKVRSLRISWPPSKDDFHPTGMIYSVQKNGKTINAALANNFITVGFTPYVRSFRICVKAVNSAGYSSPYGCTTFSGQ